MTLHRLIAERLPWPTPAERRNRENLRLQWRVTAQDGRELVARTHHPFADGSAALLRNGIAQSSDLVTMRHAGKPFDSFLPQPIAKAASGAHRRAAKAAALRQWKARQQP